MLLVEGDCICCSACFPECDQDAIYWGEEHAEIDVQKCDECAPEQPACIPVCPVEVIVRVSAKRAA